MLQGKVLVGTEPLINCPCDVILPKTTCKGRFDLSTVLPTNTDETHVLLSVPT